MKVLARLMFGVLCLVSLMSAPAYAKYGFFHERVFTLSNNADHNAVLVFKRGIRGQMQAAGEFDTGGQGTGGSLGNQGALALSKNQRYLFAVNPGSNDVSVFRVWPFGLTLLDKADVDGLQPVSIAVSHNRVYVVNAQDDSIFGFRFDPWHGKLYPLSGSKYDLSGSNTAPAQISFNPSGDTLVVTEKATNKISSFPLDQDGLPITRHVLDSAGQVPFGFAFGKRDQFFVSEAAGLGNGNGATVSSYQIEDDGSAGLIAGAVAVNQMAACWLVTTPNSRMAFTANTPAGTLSSFAIDSAGHLRLLETIAAHENAPRDMAISDNGKILFTLNGGDNTIAVYRVMRSGKLHKIQTIDGLPTGFTGLVAR